MREDTPRNPASPAKPALVRLPPRPTRLIGREREVAALTGLLLRDDVRLVTITGAPGVGKTHLSVEVAGLLAERFGDGAAFIDLASISDPFFLPIAIARTLGIPIGGSGELEASELPLARVKEALRDTEQLLVLDNFEQIVTGGAQLSEILSNCHRIKFLVTSRVPLRLTWEIEYPLQPLALPDMAQSFTAATVLKSPSVSLFLERARAVKPDFVVDDRNAGIIAEICARLDGLPLGIELAAARVRSTPLTTLSQLMNRRLEVLVGGPRDVPGRQQTLRAAIDWSYQLLGDEERALFCRLAIFTGGATIDAINATCGHGLTVNLLQGLAALVDNSLLFLTGDIDGASRYRMLESLREFGLEQLARRGEIEEMRRRHVSYYVALGDAAEPALQGSALMEWLDLLEREHDNIRSALDSLLSSGDIETALGLENALVWFWFYRDHVPEGLRWLRTTLGSSENASSATRLKGMQALYIMTWAKGDYALAHSIASGGLELAQSVGLEYESSLSYFQLAQANLQLGNLPAASDLLTKGLELARRAGNKPAAVAITNNLGVVARIEGNLTQAGAYFEESLRLSQELGNVWDISLLTRNLGMLAYDQDDPTRGEPLIRTALVAARELGNMWLTAGQLLPFAVVAYRQGKHERAARLFGAATHYSERIHASLAPLLVYYNWREAIIPRVRAALGDTAFERAWKSGQRMNLDQAIAYALGSQDEDDLGTGQAVSALTSREAEVAALVAQGLSNRDIAKRLFISERTADTHVQHILNKLGFNSRTQIATWAAQHGLAPAQ